MGRTGGYGPLDHARWAKLGFLLGIAMFPIGAGGDLALTASAADVPAWVHTVLIDLEALGILAGLRSPFVFGVAFPLLR